MFVRARPVIPSGGTLPQEQESSRPRSLKPKCTVHSNSDEKWIKIARNDPVSNLPVSSSTFVFDKVFDGNASQANVFEEVREYVDSAMDGRDSCVFAYGQTASGKSYTVRVHHVDSFCLLSCHLCMCV